MDSRGQSCPPNHHTTNLLGTFRAHSVTNREHTKTEKQNQNKMMLWCHQDLTSQYRTPNIILAVWSWINGKRSKKTNKEPVGYEATKVMYIVFCACKSKCFVFFIVNFVFCILYFLLAPTGALIVLMFYYSIRSAGHFLRFRAFLPLYLVFLFENWMQIDNNWPWGPWWL